MPDDSVLVVGYGMGFRPVSPFQVGRLPQANIPDTLIFAHLHRDGRPRNLLVAPGQSPPSGPLEPGLETSGDQVGWVYRDGPDGPSVHVGLNVEDPREVAFPVPGSHERAWFLRTRGYEVQWPQGWGLSSTQPGSAWPFELSPQSDQAADTLLVLRGPLPKEALPSPPDRLVGPGQELVDMQATEKTLWVEAGYRVNGADWRQRLEIAALDDRVVLVTGQAPADHAQAVADACSLLARSLRPAPGSATVPFSLA